MTDFSKISDFSLAMIDEYEQCLRTNRELSKMYFFEEPQAVIDERAIILFKYFFEKIMQWTPQEALNYFDEDTVRKAKLMKAYKPFSKGFPADGYSASDYFYVVKRCYPEQIHINKRDLIIAYYKKVLENGASFPRKFFSDSDARDKARIMLQYALISRDKRFDDIDDIYSFFADKSKCSSYLDSVNLKKVCTAEFDSPLEFMHLSLAPQQRDDFLYNYYSIKNQLEEAEIDCDFKTSD